MASSVITVAQQKGGAGKTTLVAHLAVAWAKRGERVAVVDIDPQASLTQWFAARARVKDAAPIDLRCVAGWRLAGEIDRLSRDFSMVVVDSPPHAETEAKIAVRAAQLVVIPVQPSPMDLWATKVTLDLARKEKRAALMVFNRLPARGRLAEAMREKIRELENPLAAATIGNRVALASSLLEGRGIAEFDPSSTAAAEIDALAVEIKSRAANGQRR
jgi:chromosome partitioning protein